jgi:hypothetical protein
MAKMNAGRERTLAGAFRAAHLGGDTWRLRMSAAHSAEIFLSGVDRDAFAMLQSSTPSAITVAWSGAGATVTLLSQGASAQFRSRTATIHEPLPELYQGLPLVVLDAAARRFWRRAFLIARIPGGRRLLRWIAQRTRGG